MIVGFFAVWAKVIMLHRSNMVKQIFDFIVGVFYFVVLLCKGSVFMLGGQEVRWFLLVLLRLNAVSAGVLAWFSCYVWQFGTQKRHERFLVHTLRS
jgi:hypothetical protein